MKQLILLLCMGLLLISTTVTAADRVQDVKALQQGNRMVLEYTLAGDKSTTVSFSVTANGKKYTADSLHLEGDYGKNVAPGKRRLVWNVLQDFPRGLQGKVDWILTAGGGGGTDPTTRMEFVAVPGGCFQMGDTFGDGDSDEKPVHQVCVSDFSIGKYEVTNAQYRRFKPGHSSGDYKGNSLNSDSQPVVNVSWDDAVAYARWLSQQSGRNYRLPTEAEWEYAARGGTKNRNYWGNGKDDACSYANVADQTAKRQWSDWKIHNCNDGYAVAAPVGSFRPNSFGLYDMMGNVWELCSDWFGEKYYGESSKDNPQGPSTGSFRVTRGGSWYDGAGTVRSAIRDRVVPGFRHYGLGFRLVLPSVQ